MSAQTPTTPPDPPPEADQDYCYICARRSRSPVCRRCEAGLVDSKVAAEELRRLTGRAVRYYGEDR